MNGELIIGGVQTEKSYSNIETTDNKYMELQLSGNIHFLHRKNSST